MPKLPIAALLLLAAPAAAMAQATRPNCPADAQPLPAELSAWGNRAPLTAAKDVAGTAGATLAIGQAVDLALRPTPELTYALRPEKPGGSVSHGGLIGFSIDAPGTYRVALGSAAWIDVVQDGKAATSVGHGHGPACSGIRKMVDFALTPGRYVLQIAGNGTSTASVLIARLP